MSLISPRHPESCICSLEMFLTFHLSYIFFRVDCSTWCIFAKLAALAVILTIPSYERACFVGLEDGGRCDILYFLLKRLDCSGNSHFVTLLCWMLTQMGSLKKKNWAKLICH